jgi:RecJ-like exonuclease
MKQKGEEFCNVCKGARTLNIITTSKNPITNKVKKKKAWAVCVKCSGTGKIDWVQKVIDPRRLP